MPTMPAHPERDLQRLLAEEPFVRMLAQQLVVDDADEVVQQTWLRAVQQGGGGVRRPRHWLARIVRNVAANLRRANRRRRDRDRAAAVHELVPSSATLAEREERRRALVAAVDSLPAALRTVVLLRWFDGLPPRRIAATLGVSPATVSTQLQRALELLRQRLDAAHGGDRRAWLVPLVPFVLRPAAPLAMPLLLTGAIAMTTKTKIAVPAAVLLLAAGYLLWPDAGAPSAAPRVDDAKTSAWLAQARLPDRAAPAPAPGAPLQRMAVAEPVAAATTGALAVHVRYGDDHAPAPWVTVTLRRPHTDPRFDGLRRRTDDAGTVQFDRLLPGRFYVSDDNGAGKRVEIKAGETAELTLDLETGMTIAGVVVDDAHVPVADAMVETTMMARADTFPEVVAITGGDGRFRVRAQADTCLVGARAAGYTASAVRFLHGRKGNTAEVELVLGRGGGAVDGLVVDDKGLPIANAVVIVGSGKLSGIPGQDHVPPFAALARSDADGRFHAVGIAAGEQPLQARASGYAPWTGTCVVAAGATVTQRIALAAGAVIHGTVTDAAGKPVDRADVEIGYWDDLAHVATATAADGSFELTGVPSGEFEVRAAHDDLGKARQKVRTDAATPAVCDLRLSRGLELAGRVVDDDRQPVAGVYLECMAERADPHGWFTFARTDADGRFVAANCPETGTIAIWIRSDKYEQFRQLGIDPRTPQLELQLVRLLPSTVRITGLVVDPDGRPVANAEAYAARADARTSSGLHATDNQGRFELGPMPPGTWRLSIRIRDFPEFVTEPRELAANATWDLGTITLERGGTARVHLLGRAPEALRLYAIDAGGKRTYSVADAAGGYRTSALVAGDYLLMLSGKGIAAQAVPFTIRSGEETVVDAEPRDGVSQRFVCDLPAGAKPGGVSLRLLRGEALQGRAWASVSSGEETSSEVWLAPGAYRVAAEFGELRGHAAFTVGAAAGPAVHVTLR